MKTAIAGEDANWGRVVAAVARPASADRDKLSIWFGGIRVAHWASATRLYDEAEISAAIEAGDP